MMQASSVSSIRRSWAPRAAALAAALAAGAAHADQWCVSGAAIPDNGTLQATVSVPPAASPQTIVSVRVRLVATHPWVGDLEAWVVHPSGFTVAILDRPGMPSNGYPGPWGCGGDGVDAWFSDLAPSPAESACPFGVTPALGGELRPTAALAQLAGRAPAGVWTIAVRDAVVGDAGTLASACLDIVTAPDCNLNGVPDANDIASGTSADTDMDGVPDECGCSADLNGDGAVGGADLAALLGSWGTCAQCAPDLTGDGQVAADDLAMLLSQWGACGAQ